LLKVEVVFLYFNAWLVIYNDAFLVRGIKKYDRMREEDLRKKKKETVLATRERYDTILACCGSSCLGQEFLSISQSVDGTARDVWQLQKLSRE
jgi:hypothetical protein